MDGKLIQFHRADSVQIDPDFDGTPMDDDDDSGNDHNDGHGGRKTEDSTIPKISDSHAATDVGDSRSHFVTESGLKSSKFAEVPLYWKLAVMGEASKSDKPRLDSAF